MLKIFNKILLTIAVLSVVTMFAACSDNAYNQGDKTTDIRQERAKLEEANRNLVKQEKEIIDEYITNNGLEFVKTGTGLRYRIANQGDSTLIKSGDIITMEYELRLLNGELLYSSDNGGYKVFVVGRGGVESGLEEAVLYLHKGDEAEIIIPSYLAHGLTGDGIMIPPHATLLYKVKIIDNQINK